MTKASQVKLDLVELIKEHLRVVHSVLVQGSETILEGISTPTFVHIDIFFLGAQELARKVKQVGQV